MTQLDPAQRLSRLRSDLARLGRDAESMAEKVRFNAPLERVSQRIAGVAKADAELDRLLGRGFLWTAPVDAHRAGLDDLGRDALRDARQEGDRASAELRHRVDALHRRVSALKPDLANEAAIDAAGDERDLLDRAVDAAADRIDALTAPFCERYDALVKGLAEAHAHLDRFEEATFRLLPEENPVAAVAATWEEGPEGKIEGVLFFTDLRLRFEARTTVATKKFLFFTTESETVKKVLLDAAIGHIAESTDSKRGLVMKDQLLKLTWSRDADVPGGASTFDLDAGTAAEWDALVEEIRSGGLARRRRAQAGPAAGGAPIGTPVKWPEKCEACSAPLPPPVKGQTSIACPFCGQAHAVEIVGA